MNQKNIKGLLDFIKYLKDEEKNKINLNENESNLFAIIKYIFLNKNIIQDKLYNEDIIISLNSEEEKYISKDLSCILPLTLLISDSNFNDFSFSPDFIFNINGLREKKNENVKYKNVIMSKILLALIDYYKGLDEFFSISKERKEKIEKIKIDNNEIINNNTSAFNQFGVNISGIKSKNIKEIYIEILKELISKNNYKKFDIIEQLSLNSLLNNLNDKKIGRILEEILNNLTGEKNYNISLKLSKDNNNSSDPTLKSKSKSEVGERTTYNQKCTIFNIHKKRRKLKYTVEFIEQIGHFFIIGFNNSLFIYDDLTKNKKEKKKKWIYNILNNKEYNEEKIEISICSKNIIESHRYEKGEIRHPRTIFENLNSLFLMRRDNLNEYYICTIDNVLLGIDESGGKTNKIFEKENFLTKSGIKLNESLMIFKSNKIASKGKDKLKSYNYKNKTRDEILSNNEEYSFVFSINGLETMDIGIENKNKVLLCACKKYIKNQKNGILVLNFEDNNYINHFFHKTNNFEVYCICPIFLYKEDIVLNKNPKTMTNFFFAGGFDLNKKQGLIKLYRLIIDEKKYCNKIEYIEDCKIENENIKQHKNNSPKGPISCIIQSNNEEKIIAGCWDGLIYSMYFDKTIDYLINLEKLSNSFTNFFS